MNGLRLSLIILGVIIVAGIFLWDRRRRRSKQQSDDEWSLPDPLDQIDSESFTTDSDMDDVLPDEQGMHVIRNDELDLDRIEAMVGLRGEDSQAVTISDDDRGSADVDKQSKPPLQDCVLVLSVIGRDDQQFDGSALCKAIESAGLQYGEHKIFHLYPSADTEQKISLFSIASILEPGSFEREKMASLKTPGIVLFLQLPGPWDGKAAFERMVTTARMLADQLGGKLCDERRRTLTDERLNEMRNQASGYTVDA